MPFCSYMDGPRDYHPQEVSQTNTRQIHDTAYLWNLKKRKSRLPGTSLVAEWLRIHLAMQGTVNESPHAMEQLSLHSTTRDPTQSSKDPEGHN